MTVVRTLAMFAFALVITSNLYAKRETILDYFEKKGTTKVFVKDVVNSSGHESVDSAGLKEAISEALSGRKSHKFDVVDSTGGADIVLSIDVLEYLWTDKDPVDNITGSVTLAYDALTTEDYTRMEAKFVIEDAASGHVLWERKLRSTISSNKLIKKEVPIDKSPQMNNERITKNFIRHLFKKPKK